MCRRAVHVLRDSKLPLQPVESEVSMCLPKHRCPVPSKATPGSAPFNPMGKGLLRVCSTTCAKPR